MKILNKFRVGLIGTGYIANVHMEVLKGMRNVQVISCCDVAFNKAEAFKEKWGIADAYNSISKFLAENNLDVVHVLVPPNYHYQVAKEVIKAGVNVFIEKPMSLSKNECEELIRLSKENHVRIGVNHNAIFHPLFLTLRKEVAQGRIGKVSRVVIYQTGPLGQLSKGKFSHWMFQSPENIIFEQAPHPVSQVIDLLGGLVDIKANAYGKTELTPAQFFYNCWQAIVECEKGIGFIHLSFGDNYYPQNWIHITGQDGVICIDLLRNLYIVQEKTIFPDYFDPTANAFKYISCILQGIKNFVDYALSKVKLRERSDAFFISIKSSIETFYDALIQQKSIPVSGEDGKKVVEFCEGWIQAANPCKNPKNVFIPKKRIRGKAEILITGANGFIGSHLIKELVSQGINVKVFVRSVFGLKPALRTPFVEIITGDITNLNQVKEAIKGIKYVYHLAHGGGETWEDFYQNNVLATKHIAEACLENKVKYLIFTSTIAVYCYKDFSKGTLITEKAPIDSKPEERNFYARSKILAENLLLKMFKENRLPVVIFRPAVVLGEGSTLYHGGIGEWARDNVCTYWGSGRNPLPFILVEDVAKALAKVLEVDGLDGEIFNLAGDVCFSAKEYVNYLKKYSHRNIKAFPCPIYLLYLWETFKYLIKIASGQSHNALLSYRDLYNREIPVKFDCTKAKSLLSWQPCNDYQEFLKKAIGWAFK